MEIKVYNWEYFDRGKTRYIIFALVVFLVVIFSILSKNIIWWVFVFLITWWYIFYLTKVNDTINITIWENSLQINKTLFTWDVLKWFVLEYHLKKEKIHNIVFIDNKNDAKIYTLKDTDKNIQNFIEELSKHIQMLEKYDQSNLDKFLRKIKL